MAPGYTISLVDLANETDRQVIVDREAGQYLGHPTTVLLEDDKTMIAVYPKGHGRGGARGEHAGANPPEECSLVSGPKPLFSAKRFRGGAPSPKAMGRGFCKNPEKKR